MRSPHLYDTLRRFCLGAFAAFHRDLDSGADLPFSFEEHGSYGRPTLYEYRPLVRGFVEARVDRLYARDDVRSAVDDLQREPAARIFARAHEGVTPDESRALYRSVLVPLLVRTAEGCGGFDWDDQAFDRAYAELEESLFGDGHAYGAVAPLVGISCGTSIDLGGGIRVRAAAAPASSPRCGPRRPDCCRATSAARPTGSACSSSSARSTAAPTRCPTRRASSPTPSPRSGSRPLRPSPPALCCSSGSTGGRTASGRCCRSPRPRRPASRRASIPSARPSRCELRPKLALADDDASLGDALDRWELALFQDDPFRGEQLRQALAAALGDGDGTWAAGMRAAALLGETRAGARRPRRPLPRADARPRPPHARRRAAARRSREAPARARRRRCSACARSPQALQSCARADTSRPLRSRHGGDATRCSTGSTASRRSTARARRRRGCCPSCARSSARRRRGRGARATRTPRPRLRRAPRRYEAMR